MIVHLPSDARLEGSIQWTRNCGHRTELPLDHAAPDQVEQAIAAVEAETCEPCKDSNEVEAADCIRALELAFPE